MLYMVLDSWEEIHTDPFLLAFHSEINFLLLFPNLLPTSTWPTWKRVTKCFARKLSRISNWKKIVLVLNLKWPRKFHVWKVSEFMKWDFVLRSYLSGRKKSAGKTASEQSIVFWNTIFSASKLFYQSDFGVKLYRSFIQCYHVLPE